MLLYSSFYGKVFPYFIMVENNILLEVLILIIENHYGSIMILQLNYIKCLEKLMNLEKNIKFGILKLSKDLLIKIFMLLLEEIFLLALLIQNQSKGILFIMALMLVINYVISLIAVIVSLFQKMELIFL